MVSKLRIIWKQIDEVAEAADLIGESLDSLFGRKKLEEVLDL